MNTRRIKGKRVLRDYTGTIITRDVESVIKTHLPANSASASASTIDMVNAPPHYISPSGLEVITVIEAFGLNFKLGTVLAYILRAGRKTGCSYKEDLKKAEWYLKREIEKGS